MSYRLHGSWGMVVMVVVSSCKLWDVLESFVGSMDEHVVAMAAISACGLQVGCMAELW